VFQTHQKRSFGLLTHFTLPLIEQNFYFVQLYVWIQNLLSHRPEISNIIKYAGSGQAIIITHETDDVHAPDSLSRLLYLSIRRTLHLMQQCRCGTSAACLRLCSLYSRGRSAARIASPILCTGISCRSCGAFRLSARWAGIRHRLKPSRCASEIRWDS